MSYVYQIASSVRDAISTRRGRDYFPSLRYHSPSPSPSLSTDHTLDQPPPFDTDNATPEVSEETAQADAALQQAARSDQHCILFPTYAKRSSDGCWNIKVKGWAFTQKKNKRRQFFMSVARKIAGVASTDELNEALEARIGMFLASNVVNEAFTIQAVGIATTRKMEIEGDPNERSSDTADDDSGIDLADINSIEKPSPTITPYAEISTIATGHFKGEFKVPDEVVARWMSDSDKDIHEVRLLKLRAFESFNGIPEVGKEGEGITLGVVNLVPEYGVSIISDIDDTIKDTGVTSGARTVLANTFLYEPKGVEGMAELYQDWYNKGASVHYVSNSPWALFPMLRNFFRESNFPPGSAHLRFYPSIFTSAWQIPGQQKRNNILRIIEDFPNRKFVLVGDSGEIDLELYARIARENPDKVLAILIRDVRKEGILNTNISAKTRSYALYGRSSSSQSLLSNSSSSSFSVPKPQSLGAITRASTDYAVSAATKVFNAASSAASNLASHTSHGHLDVPQPLVTTPQPIEETSESPLGSMPVPASTRSVPSRSRSSSSFSITSRRSSRSSTTSPPPRSPSPPIVETLEMRIEKAQEGLPEGLIKLFKDPKELKDLPAVMKELNEKRC